MARNLLWLWCVNCSGSYHPPYCPNPDCEYHRSGMGDQINGSIRHAHRGLRTIFWIKKGKDQRVYSDPVQRFQCKHCQRKFNFSVFTINYRFQIRGQINSKIFFRAVHNRSNRSIARELGVSEWLVRRRITQIARVGLIQHFCYLEQIKINEPIAYDGLECFARSQYEPNNINQAIGVDSLFCYTFNFTPLNRKGRMSERQKHRLKELEVLEGRFNPKATRIASAELFEELVSRLDPRREKLILQTDEHFQYRRAIERDLSPQSKAKIEHKTVSSKETRNYNNILFAVNHTDLLIRRYVAAFTRETICFSKKHPAMLEKYVLHMCYKNYMKPQFVKTHKKDPNSNTHSPAMKLGLTNRVLLFHDFFVAPTVKTNPSIVEEKMPKSWRLLLNDQVQFEREFKFCRKK